MGVAASSVFDDQETPLEEQKGKLMNREFQEWSWGILRNSLIQQGVTIHNLMVLEFAYLYWYQQLEYIPMNVPLEDVLNPLYDVELESYLSDFPEDLSSSEREAHKEIITASLTSVKSFISGFGVITADFFQQDKAKGGWPGGKSGTQSKGKSKDTPKGVQLEQQVPKRGKSQGKGGSMNKPKEPPPGNQRSRLFSINQSSQQFQVSQRDQWPLLNQKSQLFPTRQQNNLIQNWKSQ